MTTEGFAKVRMIGSAATSLANVACGFADAYVEYGIMLWDVAAGLSIVKGAGGDFCITPGLTQNSLNVAAGNPQLLRACSVNL
jgi:myo-inositol-1(or 4)-monophosphatase